MLVVLLLFCLCWILCMPTEDTGSVWSLPGLRGMAQSHVTQTIPYLTLVRVVSPRKNLTQRSWKSPPTIPKYIILYCIIWPYSRRRNILKIMQRSSVLFGGRNSFNYMPHCRLSTRMIGRKGWIKEWALDRMDASEKWIFIKVHTTPTTAPF